MYLETMGNLFSCDEFAHAADVESDLVRLTSHIAQVQDDAAAVRIAIQSKEDAADAALANAAAALARVTSLEETVLALQSRFDAAPAPTQEITALEERVKALEKREEIVPVQAVKSKFSFKLKKN